MFWQKAGVPEGKWNQERVEEPGKGQGYLDPEEIAGEISQLKRLAPLGVIRKWEAGLEE